MSRSCFRLESNDEDRDEVFFERLRSTWVARRNGEPARPGTELSPLQLAFLREQDIIAANAPVLYCHAKRKGSRRADGNLFSDRGARRGPRNLPGHARNLGSKLRGGSGRLGQPASAWRPSGRLVVPPREQESLNSSRCGERLPSMRFSMKQPSMTCTADPSDGALSGPTPV